MSAQCPFCGESVVIRIDEGGILAPYATCSKCDAEGPYAPGCKESEVIAAFTQPAHALRAALARAERAEALVREAGVMLKEREFDVYDEVYMSHLCGAERCGERSRKHTQNCPYTALLARIAELEKP